MKKTLTSLLMLLLSVTYVQSQTGFSKRQGPAKLYSPVPSTPSPIPACASPTTLTQSSSQSITNLNSVSCNDAIGHTNNSYWRAFTLVNAFDVSSVEVGVEDAISGSVTQQITVRIYNNTGGAFPAGTLGAAIATATQSVPNQSGTILSVPISASLPAGAQMVVEVFTPDGRAAGNLFFIGSNAAAETGPSYLSAPDCNVTTPTTTAGIGSPNMHIVMNVIGCMNCANPPTVSITGPNPICQGLTTTLSPTTGGTWVSSNPAVATVTNAGVVMGVSAGTANFTFTQTEGGCSATTGNVTVKAKSSSALTASKVDVCPNTEITLDAHCSLPNATVQWNPGAPTVTPNAPTTTYVYKASCTLDGCTGNESSVEVRTHRILVDMKDLGAGALPKAIVGAVKDNMAPTNQINAPTSPRRWTFIANGCDASESAVFKLSGPVNFSTIDNAATYAMFANDAGGFYSLDHPNYGNGGSFPNGTYTLVVDLRTADGVGGPFPKNRIAMGNLLANRTLQFTVGNPDARMGVELAAQADEQDWLKIGQNPVHEQLTVHLSGQVQEEVELVLVNLQGRSIHQRSLKLSSNQQSELINMGNTASGLYILKAIKGDKVKTLKVIKAE